MYCSGWIFGFTLADFFLPVLFLLLFLVIYLGCGLFNWYHKFLNNCLPLLGGLRFSRTYGELNICEPYIYFEQCQAIRYLFFSFFFFCGGWLGMIKIWRSENGSC